MTGVDSLRCRNRRQYRMHGFTFRKFMMQWAVRIVFLIRVVRAGANGFASDWGRRSRSDGRDTWKIGACMFFR